jgi:hypothetical protein
MVSRFGLTFVIGGSGAMGGENITGVRENERRIGQIVRGLESYLSTIDSDTVKVINESLSMTDFANRAERLINGES